MPQIRGIHIPKESSVKNYIINGNFDIWQRGTTLTAISGNTTYSADRWVIRSASENTPAFTNLTVAKVDTGASLGNAMKISTTDAITDNISISQRIESVTSIPLQGKTLTFSVKVARIAALPSLTTFSLTYGAAGGVDTAFTSPGTEAGVISLLADASALSTSYTTYTASFVVSATMASNGFSVSLKLTAPQASANFTSSAEQIRYSQFMLNEGPVAAPFQTAAPNIQAELAMCQRYYEAIGMSNGTITDSRAIVPGEFSSTTNFQAGVFFRTSKRVAPTISFGSAASNWRIYIPGGTVITPSALGSGQIGTDSFNLNHTTAAQTLNQTGVTLDTNGSAAPSWIASAEL